jgi:hypothetical protein
MPKRRTPIQQYLTKTHRQIHNPHSGGVHPKQYLLELHAKQPSCPQNLTVLVEGVPHERVDVEGMGFLLHSREHHLRRRQMGVETTMGIAAEVTESLFVLPFKLQVRYKGQ